MNLLMEKQNIKAAFGPVDGNTAAITGARIKLDKGDRVAVVVQMGTSTAATVILDLKQHNAASSGTTKALSIDNPYCHKAGAATVFTKVVPGAEASSYDLSTLFAADNGFAVFEVLAEQLDVNNGFYWVSMDVTDTAAAKLVAGVFVVSDCRHSPAYASAL